MLSSDKLTKSSLSPGKDNFRPSLSRKISIVLPLSKIFQVLKPLYNIELGGDFEEPRVLILGVL
jgi:hypothetical protein